MYLIVDVVAHAQLQIIQILNYKLVELEWKSCDIYPKRLLKKKQTS